MLSTYVMCFDHVKLLIYCFISLSKYSFNWYFLLLFQPNDAESEPTTPLDVRRSLDDNNTNYGPNVQDFFFIWFRTTN